MIDIEKEFVEFEKSGSPRGYRRNDTSSYGDYLDSITQAQWEGWLAAKRHAAQVADSHQPANSHQLDSHQPSGARFDQVEFDAMVKKGTEVWSKVPDGWLEELRGNVSGAIDIVMTISEQNQGLVSDAGIPASVNPSGASVDSELLPCAHCGGPPTMIDHRLCWSVECEACGSHIMGSKAAEPDGTESALYWEGIKRTAIAAWNRRAGAGE